MVSHFLQVHPPPIVLYTVYTQQWDEGSVTFTGNPYGCLILFLTAAASSLDRWRWKERDKRDTSALCKTDLR